jgi:hypothetical protein
MTPAETELSRWILVEWRERLLNKFDREPDEVVSNVLK